MSSTRVPDMTRGGSPSCSPAAQRCTSRRFSFWVPSVRGSASAGQTDVLHTR
jgi:hypothetical protein